MKRTTCRHESATADSDSVTPAVPYWFVCDSCGERTRHMIVCPICHGNRSIPTNWVDFMGRDRTTTICHECEGFGVVESQPTTKED
jgi:DnaJ-class molecular chaperone